jgi:hypothetical protein
LTNPKKRQALQNRQVKMLSRRQREMNQAFSVDLACAAADHLKMLREVHTCGLDLYRSGNDLERAVKMYKQWLPTADVDDGAAENVPPPIEVIWVHHLHRLNPTAYREDCLQCLGRIVHVEKPFAFSSSSCYTPSTRVSAGNTPPAKGSIEIGFDIGEAAERQSTFLWQVSPMLTLLRASNPGPIFVIARDAPVHLPTRHHLLPRTVARARA